MSRKFLFIIITLFLLIAIPITFFVMRQQQEIRKQAAPLTQLSMSPAQISKNVGDEFQVQIMIDTGTNPVILTDMYITYDPTKLQFLSAVNSANFPNEQTTISNPNGAFHYQLTTLSLQTPFTGTGPVATLRFQALAPTTSPIDIAFTEQTGIFGIQEQKVNLLIGANPAKVTIGGGGSTIVPTPSTIPTTLTPTQPSSPSGLLNLTVTSPVNNSVTSDSTPTIVGKANSGSIITIVSSPTGFNGSITADTTGNWSFTPTQAIKNGTYTLTVTATNPVSGQTQSTTSIITIGSSTITPTTTPTIITSDTDTIEEDTSTSEIPVTGTIETTLLIALIGLIMLLGGAALPFFIR